MENMHLGDRQGNSKKGGGRFMNCLACFPFAWRGYLMRKFVGGMEGGIPLFGKEGLGEIFGIICSVNYGLLGNKRGVDGAVNGPSSAVPSETTSRKATVPAEAAAPLRSLNRTSTATARRTENSHMLRS